MNSSEPRFAAWGKVDSPGGVKSELSSLLLSSLVWGGAEMKELVGNASSLFGLGKVRSIGANGLRRIYGG